MNARRATVRTLDVGGGALLGVAGTWPWLFMPWAYDAAIVPAALIAWVISDQLTDRGWRTEEAL